MKCLLVKWCKCIQNNVEPTQHGANITLTAQGPVPATWSLLAPSRPQTSDMG